MTEKGKLLLVDFSKSGKRSQALSDDEARLLDKNDQLHFIEAHYKAVVLEDLQAILNLYAASHTADAYQTYGKTLAGFRRNQSQIATSHVPVMRKAFNLALTGQPAHIIIEEGIKPELDACRKSAIDLESASFPRYWLQAVASETGGAIFGFLGVLHEIEEKHGKDGHADRIKFYAALSRELVDYATNKCDTETFFQSYAEGVYKHINAVRAAAAGQTVETVHNRRKPVVLSVVKDIRKARPELKIVK